MVQGEPHDGIRVFVCYSAATRALARLEMVVHLSGEQLQIPFKIAEINIPNEIIDDTNFHLPTDWYDFESYQETQSNGDKRALSKAMCVKKVPSATIKNEYNFLINPEHPDISKITIVEIENFNFDYRLV